MGACGAIVLLGCLVVVPSSGGAPAPGPAAVAPVAPPSSSKAFATITCRIPRDRLQRVYELGHTEDGWRLSFRSIETSREWVRLPLPAAVPTFQDHDASLQYHSQNGGRAVTLTVSPDQSSLDIYVNYELEVNVDPDLSPRVDLMNTNGPLTGLACDVK